ncbi:MAG: hypothetical protein ACTSPB_21770, partial [Candidatus Thorarchaeota archaeon]
MSKGELSDFRQQVKFLTDAHPKWSAKRLANELGVPVIRTRRALKWLQKGQQEDQQEENIQVTVEQDRQVQKLKRNLRTSESKYRQVCIALEDAQERLSTWEMFEGVEDILVPEPISYKKNSKRHDALPILVASDWHVVEVVKGDSIGDVNEYNTDVSRERITKFFVYAAKILKMQANESDIDTLLIAAL